MEELQDRIQAYLKKIRPEAKFEIIFDEQEEFEDDFWNRYTAFSVDEPCGDEGDFNRIGVYRDDYTIHIGVNPISPVGFKPSYSQIIEAINMLQLPWK
jgi:hypothetical protein